MSFAEKFCMVGESEGEGEGLEVFAVKMATKIKENDKKSMNTNWFIYS